MIEFKQALNLILEATKTLSLSKFVDIENALFKVTSEDIICQKNLPSFNNSAMDGFAFSHKDLENSNIFKIKESIFAGERKSPNLNQNECYKIMTGAKVPDDADTIVEFEKCEFNEAQMKITNKIKKHNAYRFKGEEQKKGNVLIPKNTILTPSHIMMLAAQGILRIKIHKTPSIAVVSTGNEIKEPWMSADEDEIYNANSFGIISLLAKFGFRADYCGVLGDDFEKTLNQLERLKKYDLIITSGGISEGEADFIKKALKQNEFKACFEKVNLKPGRPTVAGTLGKSVFIALPGNPMAAFINAFLFAIPVARKLSGAKNPYHFQCIAASSQDLIFKKNRNNIVLGMYENGKFNITDDNNFGSGMISPLLKSNAIFISEIYDNEIKQDQVLKIYIYE